jgi:probable F420-dependent oxidoreductase
VPWSEHPEATPSRLARKRTGGEMEIGIRIPHVGPMASPALVAKFCPAAEAAGFDGLWTADHLVAPVHTDSRYTLTPEPTEIADGEIGNVVGLNLEMNTTLAVAAAMTERVRLWTGVAVLPIRNAVLNARQLASIDLYSGGRVRYGVGVGWLREEAEAVGMPWDRRGARADEHIRLLRTLWTATGDTVEFLGEFHRLPPMSPDPRPEQRPIPILIGGHSDAALDRVARLGDGWIAAGMNPERLRVALARLADSCARHHRNFDELVIACGERFTLNSAGNVTEQCARIVDELGDYAALGVAHSKVAIRAAGAGDMLEMVDAYGELVIPSVH